MKVLVLSNNVDAFYIQEESVTIYVRSIESHVPSLVGYDHVMIDLKNSSAYIEQIQSWKKQFTVELEQFAVNGGLISLFCAPIDVKHYLVCPSSLFENIFPIECQGIGYILDELTSLEVHYEVAFDTKTAKDLMKISQDKTLFYETEFKNGLLRFYAFSLNVSSKKALKQMVAYFLLYDGKHKLAVATQEQLIQIYQAKAEVIDGQIVENAIEPEVLEPEIFEPEIDNLTTDQEPTLDEILVDDEEIEEIIEEIKEEVAQELLDEVGSVVDLESKPLSELQNKLIQQAEMQQQQPEEETIFSRSMRTQQLPVVDKPEEVIAENTTSLQRLVVTKEKEDLDKTRELQGLIAEVNERTAVIEKLDEHEIAKNVAKQENSGNTLLIILIVIILVSILGAGAFVYFAFFN